MQSPGVKFSREGENGKPDASDRIMRSSVATVLWAVSTKRISNWLDRPQAGGYSIPNDCSRADAHRHYDVEEWGLNFHNTGAHLVNKIEKYFVFRERP